MEDINQKGIYTDFVRELANKGINVYLVCPREKRTNLPTELCDEGKVKVLKVRTGNVTKTSSFIEKGLSTLTLENHYLSAIKKYFKGIHFDMVLYSTPPITFEKVINHFKKNHKCKTYLILKDIFPQNAVDMNMIKEGSFLYKHFRKKEQKLYNMSDKIGCMSQGNVDYILHHNTYIDKSKLEVFPNAILPIDRLDNSKPSKTLEKYGIPKKSTLFVYGGNLGKPQGIDFLIKVADDFHQIEDSHLLIVGGGTEYNKLYNHIEKNKPKNVTLLQKLPKNEYDQLLEIADVGLIFLDKRFTIPNFPSRLTAYMEYSLPVLAATDKNTDLKDVLEESKSGMWSESGDIEQFINNAITLSESREKRIKMGLNGRDYLEKNYDIRKTINIITKHLNGVETNV